MKIFGLIILVVMSVVFSGPVFAKSFSDNGGNTIKDNETSLVWQRAEAGLMDWESAISYCEGLDLGGNSAWRLPSKRELISLMDYTRIDPALDKDYFPHVNLAFYWSSTTAFSGGSGGRYAWSVFFSNGAVNSMRKTDSYQVRCVR